jgi:hypothetical protein
MINIIKILKMTYEVFFHPHMMKYTNYPESAMDGFLLSRYNHRTGCGSISCVKLY